MPHFSTNHQTLFHSELTSDLPEELRNQKRWLLWTLTDKGSKEPVSKSGTRIDAQKQTNWHPFEQAIDEAQKRSNAGLGFVLATEKELTSSDPSELCVVCVDLDNAVLNSSAESEEDASKRICREWAQAIVNRFAGTTYVEVSPSGRGLKFFFLSTLGEIQAAIAKHDSSSIRWVITPAANSDYAAKSEMIELFIAKRYLAVTSLPYAGSEPVLRVVKLDELIALIEETAKNFGCELVDAAKPKRAAKPVSQALFDNQNWPPIEERVARCKSYLSNSSQAIQGQNGSAVTLLAMGKISQFGIRPDSQEAWDCAQHFNQSRCMPPWNERELRKKLRDAEVQWGEKLDESPAYSAKVTDDDFSCLSEFKFSKGKRYLFDFQSDYRDAISEIEQFDLPGCESTQQKERVLLEQYNSLYGTGTDSTRVELVDWIREQKALAAKLMKESEGSPMLRELTSELASIREYSRRTGRDPSQLLGDLFEAAQTKQGELYDELSRNRFCLFDKPVASGKVVLVDDDEEALIYSPTLEQEQQEFDFGLINTPGLIQDTTRFILETSYYRQPWYALIAAIQLQLLVADRYFRWRGTWGCLSSICVGESATGKDHPRVVIEQILHDAGLSRHFAGSPGFSPRGLMNELENGMGRCLLTVDEFGKYLETVLCAKSESPSKQIERLLLQIETATKAPYFRPLTYADKNRNLLPIEHPLCMIIGFATPKSLSAVLTQGNIDSGLVGRYMVLPPMSRPVLYCQSIRSTPQKIIDAIQFWREASWLPVRARTKRGDTDGIICDAESYCDPRKAVEIDCEGEALRYMERIVKQWDARSYQRDNRESWGPVMRRLPERTQRVAMALAFSEWAYFKSKASSLYEKPTIQISHIETAEKIVARCFETLTNFKTRNVSDTQIAQYEQRVMAAIPIGKTVSRAQITLATKLKKETLTMVIGQLVANGEIIEEQSKEKSPNGKYTLQYRRANR